MTSVRILLISLLLGSSLETDATAASETNSPTAVPDRYLLVVDVSSPMRNRATSVQESITSLLMSGMKAEIKNGDELGIWTFNNELHTGDFELLHWDDARRNEIVRDVLQFLDAQRFRENTDFTAVMPHLMDVVAHSKRITVILFSDGDELISGTPFDMAILEFFKEQGEMMRDRRVPAVTVLRGYKGRLFAHSISFPPWPVEFPPFPAEPKPEPKPTKSDAGTSSARASQPDLSRTLVTTNKGPIVFAEPLIVSSRTNAATTPDHAQSNSHPAEVASVEEPQEETRPVVVPEPDDGRVASPEPERQPSDQGGPLTIALMSGAAIIAVLGAVVFVRRQRSRSNRSLITKSMERKRRR